MVALSATVTDGVEHNRCLLALFRQRLFYFTSPFHFFYFRFSVFIAFAFYFYDYHYSPYATRTSLHMNNIHGAFFFFVPLSKTENVTFFDAVAVAMVVATIVIDVGRAKCYTCMPLWPAFNRKFVQFGTSFGCSTSGYRCLTAIASEETHTHTHKHFPHNQLTNAIPCEAKPAI